LKCRIEAWAAGRGFVNDEGKLMKENGCRPQSGDWIFKSSIGKIMNMATIRLVDCGCEKHLRIDRDEVCPEKTEGGNCKSRKQKFISKFPIPALIF